MCLGLPQARHGAQAELCQLAQGPVHLRYTLSRKYTFMFTKIQSTKVVDTLVRVGGDDGAILPADGLLRLLICTCRWDDGAKLPADGLLRLLICTCRRE